MLTILLDFNLYVLLEGMARFKLLGRALAFSKKRAYYAVIIAHFWCAGVTCITISSNHNNFGKIQTNEKGREKYYKYQNEK